MDNYTPTFLLHDLVAVVVVFGQEYNKNANDLDAEFHEPFLNFLHKKVLGRAREGYLKGTILPLALRSMPAAMAAAEVTSDLETLGLLWGSERDAILGEVHDLGFTDADGSVSASVNKRPRQAMAILGDTTKSRYKKLLGKKGYRLYPNGAARTINDKVLLSRSFTRAVNLSPVMKNGQWSFTQFMAGPAMLCVPRAHVPEEHDVKFARLVLRNVLIFLNSAHLVGVSGVWLRRSFARLRRKPCVLEASLGGLMGADGGVGYGRTGCGCYFYQSNKWYCEGLADVIEEKWGYRPTVTPDHSGRTLLTRASYKLTWSAPQVEHLMITAGAFDYNRADQWLILILKRLIHHEADIPNKANVQDFLHGLSKYVRKVQPS